MMTTATAHHAPSRSKLLLITMLLALSTVLFVVGSAVERGLASGGTTTDSHREAGASQEASEGEGAHNEAGENAEASEAPSHTEAAEPTIAGINLESPLVAATVVLLTVLLIAALWRFGYPVLFVVLIVASLATIADVREIIVQIAQARYSVAALAAGVAVARAATVIVTLLTLREARTPAQRPALKV
jgi:hypothetical protein